MTTNNSDSDPNFHIPPHPSSNAITPVFPNPNLQLALSPSYDQIPRKKRTKTVASSSSSSPKSSSKPKYPKKPDPNAPKITRPCTECGKQFWSWKALFGHMRCHPERQWRGINPPPNHQRTATSSSLASLASEEDHDIASCLLMLANGSTTGSSSGGGVEEARFECGGCKKVFGSHQALGGHRATHKHVKGCFAITNLTEDRLPSLPPPPPPHQETVDQDHKSKSLKLVSGINHRCNICFRVFSSGQALGGHMRCHWEKDQEEKNQDSAVIDLNVPATNLPSSSSETFSECSLDLRLGL